MGKTVITIDLNPLSRTARAATITIVDNIVRAMPKLVEETSRLKSSSKRELEEILKSYNNNEVLAEVLNHITARLKKIAENLLQK